MTRTSASALIAAIITTGAALLASGCAAGTVSTGTAPAGTGVPGTTALARTPAQLAAAAARRLLGDFVPPPGATRYRGEPAGDHGGLTAVGGFGTGAMAQDTSWWLVSGPGDVASYEKAHLPKGFRVSFSSGASSHGVPEQTGQAFELLPDNAPLTKQYLIVTTAPADGGKTAIRVDADVAYQPARPATERVPATARVVTVTQTSGYAGHPPAPVTITSSATVAALIAYVNALPVSTAAKDVPCPSASVELRLDFRARPGGPLLAVMGGPSACDILNVTVGGRAMVPLAGYTFNAQVLRLAGLHWKLLP